MEGRPAEGAGDERSPDSFVVRPSRRRLLWEMAATAATVLVVVVLLATQDTRSAGSDIVLIVLFPAIVAMEARVWWRVPSTDALMEATPNGVRINHLGHGWATLPWDAVGIVTPALVGRAVVIRIAPGAGPSTPGVVWPSEGLARRWTRWRGFRVPTHLSDARAHEVMAAVARLRPPRL